MCHRLLKRVLDDDESNILLPGELPDREASAVGAALERWRELRARAEALRPVLQREDQLMQEILDHGLRGEDRRTLRRLASGSSEEAEEVAARQVAAAIGSEMQALKETLVRNRRELLDLSATTLPDRKRDLVVGLDAVRSELQGALEITRGELLAAKDRGDLDVLRSMGRSFNDLKVLLQRLEGDRRKLTKNSALAALLVTVCRRVLPVRQIDPSELRDIPPSHEGFLRIADFHLFSDAGLYDFGEHCSGPNLFTRLKRNVAILHVRDAHGNVVYNAFAVSGELNTPGAPPVPDSGPLRSIEAEDEHGRLFDRRFDAEFKLLSGLCAAIECSSNGESSGSTEAAYRHEPKGIEPLRNGVLQNHQSLLSLKHDSSEGTCCGSVVSGPSALERPESPPRKIRRTRPSDDSCPRPQPTQEDLLTPSNASTIPIAWEGTGMLWSRKPLCRSCAGAVRQVRARFPRLRLEVSVGESDEVAPLTPPSQRATSSSASVERKPSPPPEDQADTSFMRERPKSADEDSLVSPASLARQASPSLEIPTMCSSPRERQMEEATTSPLARERPTSSMPAPSSPRERPRSPSPRESAMSSSPRQCTMPASS